MEREERVCVCIRARENKKKEGEEGGMEVEEEGRREGGKKEAKEQEREGGRRGREAGRKKRNGWEEGRGL